MTRIANDTRPGRVYVLRDPRDNAVRYVGKTVATPENRLRRHVYAAPRGRTRCPRWIMTLRELGLWPIIEVIEEVPAGGSELNAAETKWIAHFKEQGADLCNHTLGGDGGATYSGECRMSSEGRARVVEALRTNEERKRKISEAKKRQWQDPEYRAKMLEAGRRGASASSETFARLRGNK